ncbi:heme chaperone HemW [Gammaproteobacteria bacterium]
MNFTIPPPLPLGLYVHVPWCIRKCPYCDFNSHALGGTPLISQETLPEAAYLRALVTDLEQELLTVRGRQVSTIFIGGGTPSLLSPAGIDQLLTEFHARLPIANNAEVTLEANPGTVDAIRFKGFKAAGINRLSLGIQSFHDGCLVRLGRIHGHAEALAAFEMARRAGFDNINLDLMFGLPGQDLEDAQADLVTAITLEPEHISYYQLTLEPHTAFHRNPPPLPDDDTQWAMQEQGISLLAAAGYAQYEISAYSRPDRCCRHNLNYWEFGDYLGIGAGAHGKVTDVDGIRRRWKVRNPQDYLTGIKNYPATKNQHIAGDEPVTADDLPVEFMLNALRLVAGVPTVLYTQRTGLPLAHLTHQLITARSQGWLEHRENRLMPTVKGRRFLNDLLELFLPDDSNHK